MPADIPPMQEVYPVAGASVQVQPDGSRVLVMQIPLPKKIILFPMEAENANALGQKLMAPSIDVASNGQMPVDGAG